MAAVIAGHAPVVRQLVTDGAKVDARCRDGLTALHISMAKRVDPAVVHALIDVGADMNALDDAGNAPLHTAAENNHALGVKALAEAGADLEARNANKATPLHTGCRHLSCDAVNALLQLGADTAATDTSRGTPRKVVPRGKTGTDKVRGLLKRARAIRAWYHWGWVVMLRARRLHARVAADEDEEAHTKKRSQGETAAARGEAQGRRRDASHGSRKKSGRGMAEVGPPAAECASSPFAGAVSLLLGFEDDQLLRKVVLYL